MRLTVRQILAGASLVLVILLISILSTTNLLSATQDFFSSEPPDRQPPEYLVTIPAFAGKLLHWTQINYAYNTTSSDSANGRPIQVEIWAQIGDNGIPIKSHAVSRFLDGSFHQEVVVTPDKTTIIFDSSYPDISPTDAKGCKQSWPPYTVEMRRSLLPLFVDEEKLSRAGFTKSDKSAQEQPTTIPLAGVQPIQVYGREATPQTWESRQVADGITNIDTMQVAAQGRVVFAERRRVDSSSKVTNETHTAFGMLEVYAPSTIPEKVFAISPLAMEACSE